MNYNPLSPPVQDNPYPDYKKLGDEAPAAWIEPIRRHATK